MRQTSLEAYQAIEESGLLSKRRWQVYQYLFQHGPCTATQVTNQGVPGGWKRLSELRDFGVVDEVGQTACPKTGQTVILWDVNNSKVVSITKAQVKKNKVKLLERQLEIATRGLGHIAGGLDVYDRHVVEKAQLILDEIKECGIETK